MFDMTEISKDLLNKLFNSNVLPRIQLCRDEVFPPDFTPAELTEIRKVAESKATVVGIDIYQYSQFPTEKQMFVPHLFDLIYGHTWLLIRQNYSFLFQEYGGVMPMDRTQRGKHTKHFISTGDGGYQMLHTPIHGIVFILTFATILRLYNADRFMRKLHSKIGNIDVRYTMTLDCVYRYSDNFYGSGIINNARILARDAMNRFLVDQNVYEWFLDRTLGIENLMSKGLEDIKDIEEFSDYDAAKIDAGHNALIPVQFNSTTKEGFKSIDVQKIGKVRQKATLLDIYNVHIQALIEYETLFKHREIFTVSIGNLNAIGIAQDGV